MNVRALLVLAVGGVAAFFLHREQTRGSFDVLDRGHVEWLLANRKTPVLAAAPPVILIKLDDLDHREHERQFESWPLAPTEWTGLLEELQSYGPKLVVLPTSAAWSATPSNPALQEACMALPGLLLGVRAEGLGALVEESSPAIEHIAGPVSAIPAFQSISGGAALAAYGARGITQIDLTDDPHAKPQIQGDAWRVPLLFRQGERVLPSLLLQAVLRQQSVPLEDVQVVLGEAITWGKTGRVAIDAAGAFTFFDHFINRSPLPTLNLDTFKTSRSQMERFLSMSDPVRQLLPQIKDSLCWIGEEDQASRRFSRINAEKVSLAEVQARSAMAMLSGRNVQVLAAPLQLATLAATLGFGLWLVHRKRRQLLMGGLFGVLLLALASMLVMQSSGIWMPVGPALVVLGIIVILSLLLAPKPV